MAINLSGTPSTTGSATIYTFPPRGRFALRIDDTASGKNLAPAKNAQLPRGAVDVQGGLQAEAVGRYLPRCRQQMGMEVARIALRPWRMNRNIDGVLVTVGQGLRKAPDQLEPLLGREFHR